MENINWQFRSLTGMTVTVNGLDSEEAALEVGSWIDIS